MIRTGSGRYLMSINGSDMTPWRDRYLTKLELKRNAVSPVQLQHLLCSLASSGDISEREQDVQRAISEQLLSTTVQVSLFTCHFALSGATRSAVA